MLNRDRSKERAKMTAAVVMGLSAGLIVAALYVALVYYTS